MWQAWMQRRLAAFRTWRAERAWVQFQRGVELKQAQYQAQRAQWTDRQLALALEAMVSRLEGLGVAPRPGASLSELNRQLEDALAAARLAQLVRREEDQPAPAPREGQAPEPVPATGAAQAPGVSQAAQAQAPSQVVVGRLVLPPEPARPDPLVLVPVPVAAQEAAPAQVQEAVPSPQVLEAQGLPPGVGSLSPQKDQP